jgi:hypothetical protein
MLPVPIKSAHEPITGQKLNWRQSSVTGNAGVAGIYSPKVLEFEKYFKGLSPLASRNTRRTAMRRAEGLPELGPLVNRLRELVAIRISVKVVRCIGPRTAKGQSG